MKKLLALVLLLGLTAGMCSGEDIAAWNLNERVHPDFKAAFEAAPEMVITDESLPGFREAMASRPVPKDDAVEVHDEVIDCVSGSRRRQGV